MDTCRALGRAFTFGRSATYFHLTTASAGARSWASCRRSRRSAETGVDLFARSFTALAAHVAILSVATPCAQALRPRSAGRA